ncbi:TonB-dependent receptor [Thalassotalea nanhaiensis]|uniref:TonB-dependent receptor n=1 Tax=Thalassotalea nanhaiensis TaxID=3065648 RepID=A0ABY9TDN5_9GAMM|nr:TonB-dependent receptor [Colwelliaceae bacterium SQ345]
MKLNKITTALSVALLGTAIAAPSYAAEDKKLGGLEVIEVTASKRVTTEKEIPMAIEAISGENLEKNNISNLEQMTDRIPNILINEGAQTTSVNVRGMGSGADRSFEQSVAMFIDDVYMPRSRSYRAPFFDMERVEVLRGPQSVLFGLNATAGSIAIHSASTQPGDDTFVKVAGGYETEYSGMRTDVIAGTSTDNVGMRLAVRYNDTGDGYVENLYTGEDENTTEETLVRATVVWDASDDLTITTKVNYADAVEEGEYGENIYPSAEFAAAMGLNSDTEYDWKRYTDTDATKLLSDMTPGLEHELFAVSVNADYQMGDHTLTANLSNSSSDYVQLYNVAALSFDPEAELILGAVPGILGNYAGDVLGSEIDESYEQSAFELRVASPTDQTFSYVVGAYVDQGELVNVTGAAANFLLGADFGTSIVSHPAQMQDTDTMSVFASVTYNLSDDFRFIFGGRYTSQDKDYARENGSCELFGYNMLVNPTAEDLNGYTKLADLPENAMDGTIGAVPLCGTFNGYKDSRTSENFMPEVVVQWDISDDAVIYAKVGESVKAGGFNFSGSLSRLKDVEYGDETALGYELGYKSSLLNGDAELNVTIFHTEFDDLQLQSWITEPGQAPVGVIGNAGESESDGIEIEFNWAATDWLTLGTSVATLTSEYSSFKAGPCYSGQTENVNEPDIGGCDKTGETTPMAPEYSGSVYADIFAPISDNLFFTAGVDVNFSDSYFTEGSLNPAGEQESFEKVNARIGITNDDNWSLSVVAKNITEEKTIGSSLPFLGMIGYTQAPRTVTIQGTYTF